ncbi:MAG: hypothetical protein K0S65_4320 [Labilithrix sp.]|jgi:hypothetical protein|nr:hypothetical protein [Labilithrix sp.]
MPRRPDAKPRPKGVVRQNKYTQYADTYVEVGWSVIAVHGKGSPTGCGLGWCSIYFNRNETKQIPRAGRLPRQQSQGLARSLAPSAPPHAV